MIYAILTHETFADPVTTVAVVPATVVPLNKNSALLEVAVVVIIVEKVNVDFTGAPTNTIVLSAGIPIPVVPVEGWKLKVIYDAFVAGDHDVTVMLNVIIKTPKGKIGLVDIISSNFADKKLIENVLDFVLLYPSCVINGVVIVDGNVNGFDNERLPFNDNDDEAFI